jgi:TPP-dependent pyruvate/acetoin dehydrogenase alpha subunit
MPRKKKHQSAATTKRKSKGLKAKSQSTHKTVVRKKKPETEVLPVLNPAKLKELYATMVKCRLLAEHVRSKTARREGSRTVSGFEAALVGACAHLYAKDCIALEHSSFVASLIKGTPLHLILARSGDESGNGSGLSASSNHNGGAAALSMETVVALAGEMKQKIAVILMFCTQHREALTFDPVMMALAATQKLPLVCLVESSFDSRLELPNQNGSGPYVAADASFYPRIPVDGCDVVGVFRVAQEAIRRAREGHGPAVIECLTSRNNNAAKTDGERTSAQYTAQDPITFMEQYLRRRGLWSDKWSQSIVAEFKKDLSKASTSQESPASAADQFDNVYSADGPAAQPAAASAS